MIRNLFILFFSLVLCTIGLVYYHFISTKNIETIPLNLLYFEDKSGVEKLDFMLTKAKFIKSQNGRQNFGFTTSNHWFKFQLEAGKEPQALSLEITNFNINHLELYEMNQHKIASLGVTGDRYPFAQRPMPTKTFVYQIYLNSYQSADYYLKLDKRNEILITEIKLWRLSDFEDKDQRAYFLWGIFFGLSLLVIVVNLSFYYSTKDIVYLWFAIYILAMAIGQMAESGLSFQYLWPNFPIFNHPEPVIQAVWFYTAALISFQQHFLQLKRHNKSMYLFSQMIKYSSLFFFFLLLFVQVSNRQLTYQITENNLRNIETIFMLFTIIISFWIIYVGITSNKKLMKLYSIGFLMQFVLHIFNAFQNISHQKSDDIYLIDAYKVLIIVFIIDLILFSYLLAVRYRHSIEENDSMQLVLVQNTKKLGDDIINILAKERHEINEILRLEIGGKLDFVLDNLQKEKESDLIITTINLIDKLKQSMQSIAANVIPIDLLNFGLAQKLNEMLEKLNQTQNINFNFIEDGEKVILPIETEIQLFRIANELINNILKHSNATDANIIFGKMGNTISLKVEDNGVGIDLNKISDGIGLKNTYARAKEINAIVEIDSNHSGTKIKILTNI